MNNEENLIIVNEHDEIVGHKPRSQVYAEGLSNFRVINAFIRNSSGELWIPRRVLAKRIFPGCLDVGVGGHVEFGETYEAAFRRETLEEIRIDVAGVSWRALGNLTPHGHGVSAFMTVYEIQHEAAPDYNPEDFIEAFWLSPRQVLERIADGIPSKDDLPILIRHFYLPR